jgi:hypothetical protein
MIGKDMEVHAASIQIEPGIWNAYVWSNAGSGSLKDINLNWTICNQTGIIKDIDYPYEFSVPVKNGEKSFKFSISGIKADNTTYKSEEMTIGVAD